MKLANNILRILDLTTVTVDEKMKMIRRVSEDEIRIQSLKASPEKAKISKVLSKIYKDKKDRFKGYIPLKDGFSLTDGHYVIRAFGADPATMLPVGAEILQQPTEYGVNRTFEGISTNTSYHPVTVPYSAVKEHIQIIGRGKKTMKEQAFPIPNTDILVNVFYLEYAFKLIQEKELVINVLDSKHPIYISGIGWDMIIATILHRNKKGENVK